MRKIAIFTEGQTELIFVRRMLLLLIDNNQFKYECWNLMADERQPVLWNHSPPNPKISFTIINVGGDEKVISFIREREENLFGKGYEMIVGLRDMYSDEYRQRATTIDENIIKAFKRGTAKTIRAMRNSQNIRIHFAIMEIEAWFLGMYNLFEKIDARLNVEYIEQHLGFNLRMIDPQKEFFRPANVVNTIYQLLDRAYRKRQDDVLRIVSHITMDCCDNAVESDRCKSFAEFYGTLKQFQLNQ